MQLYEGTIKSWKADKGFGFIQFNAGEKDIFIHLRDLNHANYQPRQGDNVCYKIVADKDGQIRAYDAFIKGQEISQQFLKKSFKKNQPREQKTKREDQLGMPPILFIAAIPFGFSAFLIKEQHNFFLFLCI
jgi:cold shock CspA family protein